MLRRALEGSLRRLGTDHLDVLLLHAWDGATPVEEVMRSLDEVVRAGLVRYVALSDVPVCRTGPHGRAVARVRAACRGSAGVLPGRTRADDVGTPGQRLARWEVHRCCQVHDPEQAELLDGRIKATTERRNPANDIRNARTWSVIPVLDEVAEQVGATPAQVAIAWLLQRPAVSTARGREN